MTDKYFIKKNLYYDSVTLMTIAREMESIEGVKNSAALMATVNNKELLSDAGFVDDEIDSASSNDLIIALRLDDGKCFPGIEGRVEALLKKRNNSEVEDYRPCTLESAISYMPSSNMVIISVPGQYAAYEAGKALQGGRHVLLFSDNVTIEQEKELKELAVKKGFLMMGPDCGTAFINGVPLAFANVVRRGSIGIVGASGTGTQEVMVQIDRFGGGVSQVIGTGGRDLKAEIGGLMMMQGIKALGEDEYTKVIVLVSKPPSPGVAIKVLNCLEQCSKKAVVDFIGGDMEMIKSHGFISASTLEDAAYKAVLLSKDMKSEEAPEFSLDSRSIEKIVSGEVFKMSAGQKYLRGLYSGGTLCDELLKLFTSEFGGIYSNIALSEDYKLPDSKKMYRHCAIDLGEDEFTLGRPHPMIDSYLRRQMILEQSGDPEAAVLLLDIVLGYGSNEDPAGTLADSIRMAKSAFEERGQYLSVIASICGTSSDPQDFEEQKRKLEEAGVIVMPSNAQASRLAIKIIRKINEVY